MVPPLQPPNRGTLPLTPPLHLPHSLAPTGQLAVECSSRNSDSDSDSTQTISPEVFDALVLATGDPHHAQSIVGSLAGMAADETTEVRVVDEALSEVSATREPVFVIKLRFDGLDSSRVPFVAAACDSRVVQWIARESTRCGRIEEGDAGTGFVDGGGVMVAEGAGAGGGDGEVWTGVSTTAWARALIDRVRGEGVGRGGGGG